MKIKPSLLKQFITSTFRPAAVIAVALSMTLGSEHTLARPLGVDVSNNNGSGIGWGSVRAAGYTYAWAKASEGTGFTDGDFVYNVSNGKAAGLLMGAYDFSTPNANSPGAEAGHFWSVAGGYILADGKSLMPTLDFETFSGVVGASTYSDWANKWCNDIVNDAALNGVTVKPILYTTTCESCNFDGSVAQWTPWIANPNGQSSQTGTPWTACSSCDVWGSGAWTLWQYSWTGSVPGIGGAVDLDVFNGASVSSLIATAGNHGQTNRKGMAKTPSGQGYWIVASDGGVFSFGDAQFYGSMGGHQLSAPMVGMAARPQGDGYWLAGSDGGIFSFGNAGFHGSMGGQHLNAPIVAVCSTASGNGYWEVGADGGIYAFGDAPYNGSLPGLNVHVSNIVGMDRNPSNGYWLVGSDGGIYSFAANFYGSMGGQHLNAPVVGMAANSSGTGYWLVGADGGIFAFNVGFYGSMGGQHLAQPMVGIAGTPDNGGYWNVAADGGIFSFGDAPFKGGANF